MGSTTARRQPAEDVDAVLDAYVQRVVDAAPPLTPAQRDRIAALLHRRRRAPAPTA